MAINTKKKTEKKVIAIKPIIKPLLKGILIGVITFCLAAAIIMPIKHKWDKQASEKKQNIENTVVFKRELDEHINRSIEFQSMKDKIKPELIYSILSSKPQSSSEIKDAIKRNIKVENDGELYRIEIIVESALEFKKGKEKIKPVNWPVFSYLKYLNLLLLCSFRLEA